MRKTKLFAKISRLSNVVLCLLMATVSLFIFAGRSSAASLSNSYVRETRMASTQTADIRVAFKTTASGGATGFTLAFNNASLDTTTWTAASGSVSASGYTVTAQSGCDVSATAASGSPTATGSAGTITVTSITALTANTQYCWDITKTGAAVTNPNTTGTYHPVITETGGATDTITDAVNIVSNDQVTVNATVPPSFTFAISGCASNIDNFSANLSASYVYTTGGCTLTVNTNAKNGWYAWASDSQTGLHSSVAGATIASTNPNNATAQTLSNGTEGYVFAVTAITQGSGSGGTTSTLLGFGNGSGGASAACTSGSSTSCTGGAGLNNTVTAFASSTGTANSAQLNIQERAAISGVTKAASDYQDVITLVGAGYF